MKIKLTGDFAISVGKKEIDISGFTTVKGLLNVLDRKYTNYGWGDCNIAINGTMYSNAWMQPIIESDEVVIMPPIEGG